MLCGMKLLFRSLLYCLHSLPSSNLLRSNFIGSATYHCIILSIILEVSQVILLTVSGMGTVLQHPLNSFTTLLKNYDVVNKRFSNSYTRTNYDCKLGVQTGSKLFLEPMDRDSVKKMMLKQEEIFKQQVQLHSSAHHSFFLILSTFCFTCKSDESQIGTTLFSDRVIGFGQCR